MKKFIFILSLLLLMVLVVSGCQGNQSSPAANSQGQSPAAQQQQSVGQLSTGNAPAPAPARDGGEPPPTPVPSTPVPPTKTPVPKPPVLTPVPPTVDKLVCEGVAWSDANLGMIKHSPSPFGGFNEPCWLVGQVWADADAGGPQERWIVAIRPFSIAWLTNFNGGTMWKISGSTAEIMVNLRLQAGEVEARDGVEPTHILILPDDAGKAEAKRLVFDTKMGSKFAAEKQKADNDPGCVGPAIVEYGVPFAAGPIIVKVNRGEAMPKFGGACFNVFADQASLDARWPAHVSEFKVKWPDAVVFTSVRDVKLDLGPAPKPAPSPAPAPSVPALRPSTAPVPSAPPPSGGGAAPAVAGKCDGVTATGPAIVEYGPPATVVKVNAGSTSPINKGGCFPFGSQSELDARWAGHKAEFKAKYPDGKVVE